MISITGLTQVYGTTRAISGVDLDIGAGDCLAVMGPSGSGRTTLLRILATQVPPSSGRVEINGLDVVSHLFRVRQLVAYGGGEPLSGNGLRVDEYLRFVAAARRRSAAGGELAAARLGLDPRASIDALTADMRRRVSLAAALAAAPEVLLFDDPFHALTPDVRPGFVQSLEEARGAGATIVFSADITDDVGDVCRQRVRLDHGRIIDVSATPEGTPLPDGPDPHLTVLVGA